MKKRAAILASPDIHEALRHAWTLADHWRVGDYVIMPDHIHLFCGAGTYDTEDLRNWVTFWRRTASKHRTGSPLIGRWQRDFWDTQMRDAAHFVRKLRYVRENPVREGLVECPDQWPFQGHLFDLPWII